MERRHKGRRRDREKEERKGDRVRESGGIALEIEESGGMAVGPNH